MNRSLAATNAVARLVPAPLALAGLILALPATAAAQPQVTAVVTTQVGLFDRTEYTVTDGPGPLDRFKAVRLTLHGIEPRDEALLLLPPLGVNHGFYEQTDLLGTVASSFAGFFAVRGYDVWQYISRMEGIPAGTCEAGIVDCSAFAGWDIQSMVDDVAFVRDLVEAENPGAEVTTGGASLGSILGFAVLNADPGRYAGAFLYEGMLFTPDPAVRALNQVHCAQGQALIGAGIFFEGAGSNIVKMLGRQADLAPAGLTPIPLFPPFLTNQQALVGFFVSPPPGPITQPVPGYFFMAGDPVAGEFEFASNRRVITNILRFVDYSPVPLVRDVSCALAGLDATHVANLGAFTGRVLGMPQCTPLSDALVEVWQADERGDYSQVGAKHDDPRCLLRASIRTDTEGHYRYTTVLPGEYPGRPRHIHYRVSRTGYATLVTQLYFDRRRGIPDALVATPKAEASGVARVAFDVTLAAA